MSLWKTRSRCHSQTPPELRFNQGNTPSVIFASVKGFGSFGPYADYKCFDMVAQAAAGAFSVTGESDGPPMRPGTTIGDSGTGTQLAMAILAAYVHLLKTGEGQQVELSMQEGVTYYMRQSMAQSGEAVVARQGNSRIHCPHVSLFSRGLMIYFFDGYYA